MNFGPQFLLEYFFELIELGRDHKGAIALVWVIGKVILMISFGLVKGRGGAYFGHDGFSVSTRFVELGFSRFGQPFLLVVVVKHHRAVLRPDVGTLPVEAGWVVAAEKGFEQFGVGYLAWVVGYLHTLGVAGFAAANVFVRRIFGLATFVTRYGRFYTVERFKHGFSTPEATRTKRRFFECCR